MGSNMSMCCGTKRNKEFVTGGEQSSTWRLFTYKELHVATNGFSEKYKLGEGGFGAVYWGKTTDGHQIAVKKLKAINSNTEMEFVVEVEILGRVRHKNLLRLRGYCAEANQRLIVYDYMPNLSLLSHLHGQFTNEMRLNWKKRINIIMGSAEALVYLHHDVDPHIIHRDIKASNVLLDSNFEPLVADFNLAKLLPEGVSHMTTRVKGTLGYLAPEYAMWGKVSESCDVYSFGILLLEIVTGRKPIERLPDGSKRTITEWVDRFIATDQLYNLVDCRLQGQYEGLQLRRILHAAAQCIQLEPDRRPTMRKVLAILRGDAAAADPVKNGKLAREFMEHDSAIRIKSVKYEEEMMDMDDEGGEEGEEDIELTRRGSKRASVHGVFGAIEVQRASHGYGQHGVNRRAVLRG